MAPRFRNEFRIAIVCALPLEADAVEASFDEHYDERYGKHAGDANTYVTGRIHNHNVVLAYTPGIGNRRSASVALGLLVSYPEIKLTLLVGICGGVPYTSDGTEIILGDIIISDSVIEYDFGRQYPHGFERKSGVKETLGSPNQEIQSFLNILRTRRMRNQVQQHTAQYLEVLQGMDGNEWNYPGVIHDTLFKASYCHKHYQQRSMTECICVGCHSAFDPICEQASKSDCKKVGCVGDLIQRYRLNADHPTPFIHIGTVASANSVMKSGEHRDQLAENEEVIGFEMEGAGVWDVLPCVIIKGVCDYADSHKNKAWQNYAAATAACCTKAFLKYWTGTDRHVISGHLKLSSSITSDHETMIFGREDVIATNRKSNQENSARLHELVTAVGLEISHANAIHGALVYSRKPEIFPQTIDQIQGSTNLDNEIFKNSLIHWKLPIRRELRGLPSCLVRINAHEIPLLSIWDEIRNRLNLLANAEERQGSELTILRMLVSELAISGETSASIDNLMQGVQANCNSDWIIFSYPEYHLLFKTFFVQKDLQVLKLELPRSLVDQIRHEGVRLHFGPARFVHRGELCSSVVSTIGNFLINWNIRRLVEGKKYSYTVLRYSDEKAAEEAISRLVTCKSTSSK